MNSFTALLVALCCTTQTQTINSRLWVLDDSDQYIGNPIPLVFECIATNNDEYLFELKTRLVPVGDPNYVGTLDGRTFFYAPEGGSLALQPPTDEDWLDGDFLYKEGSFVWSTLDDTTGQWQSVPVNGFVAYPSSECLSSIPPNFEIRMQFIATRLGTQIRQTLIDNPRLWRNCRDWPTFCVWPKKLPVWGVKAYLEGCTWDSTQCSIDPMVMIECNRLDCTDPTDPLNYRLIGFFLGWRWIVVMIQHGVPIGIVPNGFPIGISYLSTIPTLGESDIWRFRGTNACDPQGHCYHCPPMGYMESKRITGCRWNDRSVYHQTRNGYVDFSMGVRADADIWPGFIDSSAGNLLSETFVIWARNGFGIPMPVDPLGGANVTISFHSSGLFPPGVDYDVRQSGPLSRTALPSPYENDCVVTPLPCGCRTGQTAATAETYPTEPTCPHPMDADNDNDIDLADFGRFATCFEGPNKPYVNAECWKFDKDNDWDVDIMDFLIFQSCFNGPNRPSACQ